ncbi:MAG: hypothetical protein Q8P95_02745 [bacterium]|nr:hypothetical protein [bacterium]
MNRFALEMQTWFHLLRHKRWTVLFCFILGVLLTLSFFLSLSLYRWLEVQKGEVAVQVEVIAELDGALDEVQQQEIREAVAAHPAVASVDLWDSARSLRYVDQHILPGYLTFLQRHQLDLPLSSLLRIQLRELSQREQVVTFLEESFPGRVLIAPGELNASEGGFGHLFTSALGWLEVALAWSLTLQTVVLFSFCGGAYFFLLSQRLTGSSSANVFGLPVKISFLPAICLAALLTFFMILAAVLLTALVLGQFLSLLGLTVWLIVLALCGTLLFLRRVI